MKKIAEGNKMKKIAADNNYRLLKRAQMADKKVWVVSRDVDAEINTIVGIYDTEEKAKRMVDTSQSMYGEEEEGSVGGFHIGYTVESYIVS